jgi:hypothetical protein
MGAGGSVASFETKENIVLSPEQRRRLESLYQQHLTNDQLSVSQLLIEYDEGNLTTTEIQYKRFVTKAIAQELCRSAIRDAISDIVSSTGRESKTSSVDTTESKTASTKK